jgi:hypothetical protein
MILKANRERFPKAKNIRFARPGENYVVQTIDPRTKKIGFVWNTMLGIDSNSGPMGTSNIASPVSKKKPWE